MFPHQFDGESQAQSAVAPVTSYRSRKRRTGSAALLTLALTGGAIGGGVLGGAATAYWFAPEPVIAAASTTQTISQQNVPQAQTPANIAGSVFAAVGPSVVEVTVAGQVARGFESTGSGSGFVVNESGLIMTNQHVVADADNVSVTFSNGEIRTAQVLGTDSSNDLALLRVTDMPNGIPAAPLGDSDSVQVGETAIAIGSPFGLDQTVTQGIVSAIDRNWSPGGTLLRGLIQTDAPINPGNSGGPLLNANGEVIGITTLIESPVRGNVGIGFAVPINIVQQQLDRLEAGENLEQGYLGVTAAAADGNASQNGVAIEAVDPNSGAAEAGLQSGDVITAIDGDTVTDFESLVAEISGRQSGDTIAVTIMRNGEEQTLDVTLQAREEVPTN